MMWIKGSTKRQSHLFDIRTKKDNFSAIISFYELQDLFRYVS